MGRFLDFHHYLPPGSRDAGRRLGTDALCPVVGKDQERVKQLSVHEAALGSGASTLNSAAGVGEEVRDRKAPPRPSIEMRGAVS